MTVKPMHANILTMMVMDGPTLTTRLGDPLTDSEGGIDNATHAPISTMMVMALRLSGSRVCRTCQQEASLQQTVQTTMEMDGMT